MLLTREGSPALARRHFFLLKLNVVLDDFVENVPQKARQAEILFEVILHVEALLADEDPLDELVKVLILMADERLDLIGLSVRDDLVLHDLAVGRVREHDR